MATLLMTELPIYKRLCESYGLAGMPRFDKGEYKEAASALYDLKKASEKLPGFVGAISAGVDFGLLKKGFIEPPSSEILADMPDDELAVMLKIADDQVNARDESSAQEFKECVSNLECASEWGLVSNTIEEMRTILKTYERLSTAWEPFRRDIVAEQKQRADIVEKQQRRKRYIESNYLEIIEGLITGDGKDEILRNYENPPLDANA